MSNENDNNSDRLLNLEGATADQNEAAAENMLLTAYLIDTLRVGKPGIEQGGLSLADLAAHYERRVKEWRQLHGFSTARQAAFISENKLRCLLRLLGITYKGQRKPKRDREADAKREHEVARIKKQIEALGQQLSKLDK